MAFHGWRKFKPARLEFAAGVIRERTAEGREWPDRRESVAWFGDVDDVLSMRAAIAAVRWALLGAAPRAAFLRATGDGAHPGQPRPLRSRLNVGKAGW